MPPTFRIHQTKSKPERILIRLLQGRYIMPSSTIPTVPIVPVQVSVSISTEKDVSEKQDLVLPGKKKNSISVKQIKQIILLLQQTQQKDISKLLPQDIKSLLQLDDNVNPDEVPVDDEEDLLSELSDPDEKEDDNEDDVLFIDLE